MSKTNKIKTKEEIAKVRQFYENGYKIREIQREMSYSINTIRKILRRTHGYEGEEFNKKERWKNVGGKYTGLVYYSPVDNEKLYLQSSLGPDGYIRFTKNKKRNHLHRYEAEKVFKIINKKWPEKAIVHHINYNRTNNNLNNLSVFNSNCIHTRHHGQIELAMYKFIEENNLLEKFYEKYPDFKLKSLADLLLIYKK